MTVLWSMCLLFILTLNGLSLSLSLPHFYVPPNVCCCLLSSCVRAVQMVHYGIVSYRMVSKENMALQLSVPYMLPDHDLCTCACGLTIRDEPVNSYHYIYISHTIAFVCCLVQYRIAQHSVRVYKNVKVKLIYEDDDTNNNKHINEVRKRQKNPNKR